MNTLQNVSGVRLHTTPDGIDIIADVTKNGNVIPVKLGHWHSTSKALTVDSKAFDFVEPGPAHEVGTQGHVERMQGVGVGPGAPRT